MERVSLLINRFLTHFGSIALVVLMLLTVADVCGRYFVNRPVSGTFELTELFMVFIVFLALGLAQHHNEHISLDLAYNYFPSRLKKGMNVLIDFVNLAAMAAVTWQLYEYSARMGEGNYTTAVLQLPIQPFAIVAVVGTASYVLAIISDLSESIRKIRRE
ncbi:MAG TPA: TRAP transporter small permease [Candidatus Udaeobacter sp.]|nr:TRAP transporter small permease [Candidatus Udaeobacter sp.]